MKTPSFVHVCFLSALATLAVSLTACDSAGEEDPELLIEDIVVGPPSVAEEGMRLQVHYTGWLENGTQFDSSYPEGEPYDFVLGRGDVIRGWDVGLVGMRVGGKRKLTIPPGMAYGNRGAGCDPSGSCQVPPNSTLIFEVELLNVEQPS